MEAINLGGGGEVGKFKNCDFCHCVYSSGKSERREQPTN